VLDEHPTRILLSDEIAEDFDTWRREGLRVGDAQIVRFGSVSGALLDNPMAYGDTVRSLKNAVQALADYRSGELGVSPPYGLIAADVKGLVGALGLGVVAGDGLDLCAHLLLPHPERTGAAVLGSPEPFAAFASTLELATRLRFPWPLDRVLAACHRLYQADGDPKDVDGDAEIALTARILALVWHRHVHIVVPDGSDEERLLALRSALRSEGLKLAPTEVVEAYVNLIATRGPLEHDGSDRQVLLVGADRIVRSLTPALARVGRETVTSTDLGDAQTVAQRRTPSAIVIDHEAFQEGVDRFTRVAKLGGDTLLFVLTDSTDPALVLNLLDGGADDVFGPPHDFDLVAARINRSIRSRARRPRGDKEDAGQFSARFDVFSLLDLVQMLSQGMKTVRIDLQRDGEEAVLYMRKGRIIHAELGALTGEPAVHAVITWEDDGSFTVREETEFPEPTIDVPTESVLMDGLRLLDESRR
jgi:DNA-binding response OmpR family regulator